MKSLLPIALALLSGCSLFTPAAGRWDLEVEDADDCGMEMTLEQSSSALTGDADISCRIYFEYGGEYYSYDIEARGVAVDGRYDKEFGDVDLELSFYDEELQTEIELEVEGDLRDGWFEGELFMNGERFGDLTGDVLN